MEIKIQRPVTVTAAIIFLAVAVIPSGVISLSGLFFLAYESAPAMRGRPLFIFFGNMLCVPLVIIAVARLANRNGNARRVGMISFAVLGTMSGWNVMAASFGLTRSHEFSITPFTYLFIFEALISFSLLTLFLLSHRIREFLALRP